MYGYGYHPNYFGRYPGYYPQMNMGYYGHYHNWNPEEYNGEYSNPQNYPNYDDNYNYNYQNGAYEEEEEKQNENEYGYNMPNYYGHNYPHHHHYHHNWTNFRNREEQKYENNNEKTDLGEKEEKKQKTNDELILDYENNIRKEIEETTPLISENFNISKLIEEYKSNEEYSKSVENISEKYKSIRKIRRDGNCFYRSFIFRLFEHICIKNDKELFEKIKQKIIDVKELTGRNGYDWIVVEDFYDLFLKEFTDCFNSLTYQKTVRDYLDTLFKDKEKGNYLIYFIRFCIAAYLKENKEKYQMYIEGDFENWVRTEVEAIDHEADEVQIMACVSYFDIGVKIEYLNKNKREIVKLPDDKPDEEFFIFLLFTPGHYDILYP